MICFITLGNYGIHIFFKKERAKLILDLKSTKYSLIEKVNCYLTQGSQTIYSQNKRRADLIITQKNIIVLPYNYHLKGLIQQYQPIYQYTLETIDSKFNGVKHLIKIDYIETLNKKIVIHHKLMVVYGKRQIITEFEIAENNHIDLKKLLIKNELHNNNNNIGFYHV